MLSHPFFNATKIAKASPNECPVVVICELRNCLRTSSAKRRAAADCISTTLPL